MKILVAGGAGFLGSNLVESLLQDGHEVIIVDAFVTGLESTIRHLINHPRLKVIQQDITKPFQRDISVDQIYHLACPASPKNYQRDPVHTLNTCYVGTENLLKLAKRCDARILFSSTSEIYGNPLISPQPETYFGNVNSYGPRACYDEGKRVAEALCWAYQQRDKVDIRIVRIFNAYGPGLVESDGRVVSNFIFAALRGKPITITGDGSATRSFQYVGDCVDGLKKLMASNYTKPVNIGNDMPCRLDHLARLVVKLVAKEGTPVLQNPIIYADVPVDDPEHRRPDISLAKEVLNWSPKVDLETGLEKTIAWCRGVLETPSDNIKLKGADQILIPFNIPPTTGTELENIGMAMTQGSLVGKGGFTQNCQDWLQIRLSCGPVILTPSGTAALDMAALVLNIQAGDEVIMPSYTFVSTANAFALRGANIVFVDIKPGDMNIDEVKIEAAITDRTKAIVPVHYAGVSCEMDTIMALASKYNLKVVEDAAQGLLSTYRGKSVGSIGHIACLSFHESKNVTAGGQGGAVIINDESLIRKANIVAERGTNRSEFLNGKSSSYEWKDLGSSFVMTELHAAYLWSQLPLVEALTSKRLETWNLYYTLLLPLKKKGRLSLPEVPLHSYHNAHIFALHFQSQNEVASFGRHMKEHNIGVTTHYKPLHSSEPGRKFGRFAGEDKFTTEESGRLIRLPLYPDMSKDAVEKVVTTVFDFFDVSRRVSKL